MLDPEHLLNLRLREQRCRYDERDTMLYALGIGFGSDPMDMEELRFVYEDGLKAMPTQATVIGWDRSWIPATRLDWRQVVHGEQHIEIGRTLQPSGEVIVQSRVTEVLDKGTGALFRVESRLTDATNGGWICTSTASFFVRGAGGFRPASAAPRETRRREWPVRPADQRCSLQTWPHQALLYRLSGDRNPHHAWPPAAREGGFVRPLLHGLSTFGFACRSVLRAYCDNDPSRVRGMGARFLSPVFPGQAIDFELWREQDDVLFRGRCADRDVITGMVGTSLTSAD
jgi:acyl dehydratase